MSTGQSIEVVQEVDPIVAAPGISTTTESRERNIAIQPSELPIVETPVVPRVYHRDAYGRPQREDVLDDHEFFLKPTSGRLKRLTVQSAVDHVKTGLPWTSVQLDIKGTRTTSSIQRAKKGFFGVIRDAAHSALIDVLDWTWSSVRKGDNDKIRIDSTTAKKWVPSCAALFALVRKMSIRCHHDADEA
jgi:hypothetical protein